jgi:hypothetical protein
MSAESYATRRDLTSFGWFCPLRRDQEIGSFETLDRSGSRHMRRTLEQVGWIALFLLLTVGFVGQIVKATNDQHNAALVAAQPPGAPWVCPIAGQCGPPGTPGLG